MTGLDAVVEHSYSFFLIEAEKIFKKNGCVKGKRCQCWSMFCSGVKTHVWGLMT